MAELPRKDAQWHTQRLIPTVLFSVHQPHPP